MTRNKALYTDTSNEKKALPHTFILMFHQNKLQDMLDTEIVDDKEHSIRPHSIHQNSR
jgi:uncharacterized protein YnzC (UPF0291/DUF896 family)